MDDEVQSSDVPSLEDLGLSRYQYLQADEENCVKGFVNGKECKVIFDSGGSSPWMLMSVAKRLGLVTGKEKKVEEEFDMWMGSRKLKIINLPEVVITLDGGLQVRTAMSVFPHKLEKEYGNSLDHLILDVGILHRCGVIQTFDQCSSTLFFRHPERLQENHGFKDHGEYCPVFFVKREGRDQSLEVLLDTGATELAVGEACLEELKKEPGSGKPSHAFLDLGGGRGLVADELDTVSGDGLVLGIDLLHNYRAVVDFAEPSVTFTVGEDRFKIEME